LNLVILMDILLCKVSVYLSQAKVPDPDSWPSPVQSGLDTNCRCTCWDLFGSGYSNDINKTIAKLFFQSTHGQARIFCSRIYIKFIRKSMSIFKLLSPDLNFEVLLQLGLKCIGKTWKVFPSFCFQVLCQPSPLGPVLS
jgi:hypothetical protein